jgi:hypothetical protein
MKLRNKIAAITAAAMLAFTGVGFAAWAFTNEVSVEKEASVIVPVAVETNAVKLYTDSGLTDELEANEHIYLIADAPNTSNEGHLPGKGLHWSLSADNSTDPITNLYVVPQINYNIEDLKDITTVNSTITATSTALTVSDANYTYFSVAALNITDGSSTVTLGSATTDTVIASSAYTLVLPSLSYTHAPTTVAEVTAMNTALGSSTITFSISSKISSVA